MNVQRLWLIDGALCNEADSKVVEQYSAKVLHQGDGTPPPVGAILKLGNSRYPKFYQVVRA